MNKRLILFFTAAGLLLFLLYFLVPVPATVTKEVWLPANKNLVYRSLTSQPMVQKWWAGSHVMSDGSGTANRPTANIAPAFAILPGTFDVIRVDIGQDETPVQSFITILPIQADSSMLTWKAELPQEKGLFSRAQRYWQSRKIAASMEKALAQLNQFVQNETAVYGLPIKEETVTDTLLVVTKEDQPAPPDVTTYYGLIKKLRDYVAAQRVQETNYPMLHVLQKDSAVYETMVAIPVNKKIPDAGAVVLKRMIPGRILVMEVKGGNRSIEEGFRQLEFYRIEHDLRQPGRPFQSLVTDRLAEPDSSKWTTRLYYPVM